MYVEKQERYPKGTYKVLITLQMSEPHTVQGFRVVNLMTGYQVRSNAPWDLVRAIEDDILVSKYPQNQTRYRNWGLGAPALARSQARKADAPEIQIENAKILTFIVKVLYYQNATWQGSVQWLEGRQTRQYRSVNELLRLMGEAAELAGSGNPQGKD